ncbi:M-phase inducer phosphatase 3 isoform X1 [Calonectris borealis]|uniref:M-phase inducer phosphatase 3 isoform X1 n=1 Tax=Calonectris borealis TaxID=1323832 RepID=UPI003F4BF296
MTAPPSSRHRCCAQHQVSKMLCNKTAGRLIASKRYWGCCWLSFISHSLPIHQKLLAGVLSSSMAVLVSGPLLTEDTDISEEVCESQSYCPMHHQDFKVELLKFRTKSKSWTTERRKQDQTTRLMKL